MNNKKITKMLKKTAAITMLTFAAAAPLMPSQKASAATYTASKYFPGESADTDNPYKDSEGNYFRNFKHRSANIYVKDKKVKKVFQKAAKAWSPVFKFKFVKSGKHADFNSSKYANVIVKKDGGSKENCITVNKLQFFPGSTKNLNKMNKDFPFIMHKRSWYNAYEHGHIINYEKWKANEKKLIAGKLGALMPQHINATRVGMWIPSTSDAIKNSWNHYITVTSGIRSLSQAQQAKNATATLGEIIGLSAGNENTGSQSDLDYVDWIYAHPWSGSNVFWDNATIGG